MTDESTMPLHKQIAQILATNEPLSASDCAELLRDLRLRVAAIGARVEAIQTTPRGTGALRRKAMVAGDTNALRQFDAELLDLQAERQCLQGQAERLESLHHAAQAAEAAQGMPDAYRSLGEALDTAERQRKALDAALREVEQAFATAWRQRVVAVRAGHQVEGADPELVDRMLAVGARVQSAHDMRESLGITEQHQRGVAA